MMGFFGGGERRDKKQKRNEATQVGERKKEGGGGGGEMCLCECVESMCITPRSNSGAYVLENKKNGLKSKNTKIRGCASHHSTSRPMSLNMQGKRGGWGGG